MTETDEPMTAEQVAAANTTDEATEPDEETGDVDESDVTVPEPEPEPEVSESSASMEAIGKKLDGLQKHVARRMGEIMGDDAQFYRPCLCSECFGTPGWLPPVDPTPDAQAFMYHWLGQHAPGDYLDDKHSKPCPVCNGLGQVKTGSKVTGQEYLSCVECKGLGWTPTDAQRGGTILTTANGPQEASPAEISAPQPDPSEFDGLTVAEMKARGGVVIPPYVPAR